VNIAAKDEHTPKVEQQNRVIKERAREVIKTSVPYECMPKNMRIALIYCVVYWLNVADFVQMSVWTSCHRCSCAGIGLTDGVS